MGRIIASCSFGKDSIAAILVALEHGIKIDEIVYCRVMYSDTISAEYPSHEKFIHEVAIPYFQKEHGLKTTIVEGIPYLHFFYKKYGEKSKKQGNIWGFPSQAVPWCNSKIKVNAIKKIKKNEEDKYIIGIACDETKRIEKQRTKGNILPLVDNKITEEKEFEICKNNGLLSPAYDEYGTSRLGCWFCHNIRIKTLRILRKKDPWCWNELIRLQKESIINFRPRMSLLEIEQRFLEEDKKNQYNQLILKF